MFLEPEHVLHHRQPRGYLTPGQGGSYLSSRQKVVTDMAFRVKSHVYALEGQDCQYKQMFGTELRGAVSPPRRCSAQQQTDLSEFIAEIPVVVFLCRLQVMKLIQIIAQARQTAKRISDHSNEVAANASFLSWFGFSSPDPNNTFHGAEPEETEEYLKKTHEFLDRALENLCQIFKVR